MEAREELLELAQAVSVGKINCSHYLGQLATGTHCLDSFPSRPSFSKPNNEDVLTA